MHLKWNCNDSFMLYLKKRKSNDGLKKIIQTMLHLSNLMAISCFNKKKKKKCNDGLIENYFKQCFVFLTWIMGHTMN